MRALPLILELIGMGSAFGAYISQRRYGSIKQYIGCDAHARYSIFVSMDESGKARAPIRVEHDELEKRRFLAAGLPAGSAVALETSGNWYWLVRALEEAGLDPRLATTDSAVITSCAAASLAWAGLLKQVIRAIESFDEKIRCTCPQASRLCTHRIFARCGSHASATTHRSIG